MIDDAGTYGSPVIRVRDLTVGLTHGDQKNVVENVSFEVGPGETLCVVGESGSGKSVTAFSIMGLLQKNALEPTSGEVFLGDENLLQARPERMRQLRSARMSMVFQEPMTALNPVEKVGKQIEEVLLLHSKMGAAARRQRTLEMLDTVHLPDPQRIYDSFPHQLSGGQRQRVVICIALILEPDLLIADEPTTALDVTTQQQILTLIREMQERQNTAVLFITHDMGVVADIADRVVVMRDGNVVEVADKETILRSPSHDYTRMLISSVPSLVPEPRQPLHTETVLSVAGLNKTFQKKRFLRSASEIQAVADLNLTLRQKEILGVVGQSGSGKSTVARCIVGLEEPTSGDITICGDRLQGARSAERRQMRRHIQMVFQDPYRSLNPRVKVGRSMVEGSTNFGTPHDAAMGRAEELMELVGLSTAALDRYPHQFSGGQRQRICIARALMLEPAVLVADEAVSALDVSVQEQVLELLDEIRERTGVGILFITHDLRVAARICDSIFVMNQGRIVEHGPAEHVLGRPEEEYTQKLFEAAPGRHWDFRNFCPV
ncbi:putative ABC transpoter ATP-binding protein [Pseudooceanicola batsensis HTCC2597]|uniref:Putative ABC transpoter ATP-binding protein n=1 Tax=Pseudooceanicola batsensis (strain ATCC BAA-863 / DSM 15984 / KCTC 12145 / HTCC2597) TaxID=252305 RepID=A3U1A3_PSEBH|nr:ABC transporter ATP-binding protein [Pseudooceanicola batsensis]EAQ02086.1 putative ABC transpoter ATP-binding protein [Pseudooceanicola batsensis HTCC2597]